MRGAGVMRIAVLEAIGGGSLGVALEYLQQLEILYDGVATHTTKEERYR